jgi:hypothetical protein
MARRRIRMTRPGSQEENAGSKAALATGALGAMSGADTPVVSTCPPSDTSFMCRLSRFYNSVKMILNLLVILGVIFALLYFARQYLRKRK